MFLCDHCHESVPINDDMAVLNRNHCPFCLWSKHVDDKTPGDRKSMCDGMMEPIGLTMKHTRNKYAKEQSGELMLIHRCTNCEKININRIAADDDTDRILDVFATSQNLSDDKLESLNHEKIQKLTKGSKKRVIKQLFGAV